jgi:hypothetical protein
MVAQKQVALYARVSTLDKGQDPETQLLALRAYAARRGCVPAGEYVDWLLLDSRVVDVTRSYNPIFITISSFKPFLFN